MSKNTNILRPSTNKEEMEDRKSQIVISNSEKMGLRKPPLYLHRSF